MHNLSSSQPHFRFYSDESATKGGFQIQYNALNLFSQCGENFSNSSGILTSPAYPNQYQGLEDCVYHISQPNGTSINISFLYIDINCEEIDYVSDSIEIWDGISYNSPLISKICGNQTNVPAFITTSQNQMTIRLNDQYTPYGL